MGGRIRGRAPSLALAQVVRALAASAVLPSWLRGRVYRLSGLDVARTARVMSGVTFRPGRIRIGAGAFVNQDCLLDPGDASVTVEDGVALAPRVMLLAVSHEPGPPGRRAGAVTAAPIVVGRGSWLGAGVTVLGGVRIAPGCIVGAGAVVTRDTEPDGLYLGVPAHRVGDLPVPDRPPGPDPLATEPVAPAPATTEAAVTEAAVTEAPGGPVPDQRKTLPASWR